MRPQWCVATGAVLQSRATELALAVFVAVVVTACAKTTPDAGIVAEGPPIPLDTAAVREIRSERRMVDSALREPDTSQKERGAREFVRLMSDLRITTAQETLARLGYGVAITGEIDSGTRRAFKEFAKRHSLSATDSLSPEMEVALRYADDHAFIPFGLHDLSISTGTWMEPRNATVHAQGTWSPADPPRQTSNIWCYRDLRVCREAIAYILMGQLYSAVIEYDIDAWDSEELTAHSTSICMSDKLTINRPAQSAVLVRSARGSEISICDRTRSVYRESIARLVSGHAVANSLNTEVMNFMRLGPKAAALMRKMRDMGTAKP